MVISSFVQKKNVTTFYVVGPLVQMKFKLLPCTTELTSVDKNLILSNIFSV